MASSPPKPTLFPIVANTSLILAARSPDAKIEGSVELAPLLGLSDAIVDIVETGSTLKENGLEVKEDVCPISARLICNTASLKLRKAEIEELAQKMEDAITGG